LAARLALPPFEQDEREGTRVTSRPVAVSPDGRLLAWIDSGWGVRLNEIATGQIVHRFKLDCSSIAFAPSGWRLATGCEPDSSVLVWDLRSVFLSRAAFSPGVTPEALWRELSSAKAERAQQAVWRLASLPETDAFLARCLKPVERAPAEQVRSLLDRLGSDDFALRQKAEDALARLGDSVHAALLEAMERAQDVEERLRLKRLLALLQPQKPEQLRKARAVMVLEARGTAAARRLADGAPGALLTGEARAAQTRLDAR
jgi:hypothetical protein